MATSPAAANRPHAVTAAPSSPRAADDAAASTPAVEDCVATSSFWLSRRTASGRHVTYQALQGPWSYLADNEFIHRGYRVGHDALECVASLFRFHNETVNVWSHVVGSVLFIVFICHLLLHFAAEGPVPPFGSSAHPPAASPSACAAGEDAVAAPAFAYGPASSAPFLAAGRHTRVLFAAAVAFPPPSDHEDPGVVSLATFFPSIHSLRRHLQDLKGFVADASAVHAVEASLVDLCTGVHNLHANLTTDAVQRVKQFNVALRQRLSAAVSKGMHKAEDTAEVVLRQLSDMGHKVTARIDGVVASATAAVLAQGDEDMDADWMPPVNMSVPKYPIFVFLASAMLCLAFSASFHLFSCLSEEWWAVLAPLDYTGISLLIAGSSVPIIVYGFICSPTWQAAHLMGTCAVNLVCVIMNMTPALRTKKYRHIRAGCFVAAGCYGVVPMGHLLWFARDDFHAWLFSQLAVMGALYIFGALLYAVRIPERFFPGRFDTFFSSHQVFHLLVVTAAVQHYYSVISHYRYRLHHTCPADA